MSFYDKQKRIVKFADGSYGTEERNVSGGWSVFTVDRFGTEEEARQHINKYTVVEIIED